MLILKLGGAAITDKASPNTVRLEVLRRVAETLARYPQTLILVHGAGSFGHILAKDYKLHLGFQDETQKMGLVHLQQQLHMLNQYVINALVEVGLPAFPIHPTSMCIMENNRISDFFLETVKHTLAMGLIPVLYGDCVWDKTQRFGIVSGDQLAIYLANELNVSKIAFGTNVDGVLDSKGVAIPKFNLQGLAQVGEANTADVTGGMLGKLKEIAELKNPAVRTRIFNLLNPQHLEGILTDQSEVGTLLEG